MHIKKIKINNFRALEDIYVEFDNNVSVIVGPNAAGKTTVLEAIRLLKAMLTPRVQSESTQVLQSLGAISPHMPNQLRIQAIARDINKPIIIWCWFNIEDNELHALNSEIDLITSSVVQSQLGQSFAAPGTLISFLASPQGKEMMDSTKAQINSTLLRIATSKECFLELTMSRENPPNASSDPTEMHLVAHLERRLPPYQSMFTHFPADRSLPAGEQPVQLGGPDAAQQLESYNSQPQIKFSRLKNIIFSASILGESQKKGVGLQKEFEKIFEGILKGRKLVEFGVNEIGFLSVIIEDTETNRRFDLDGMSSGEKGLILTFLLIASSVAQNGIVLFDEPELHLNPAVCKDLLSYLVDEYVIPKNLQILICSHSPEILAGAFDNDKCSLYHLISSTTLSKVRPQDEITLGDALRRLGVTESENLLYRGIVFVEGPDDMSILEAGFPILLRRHKLKFSNGHKEVEKAINKLQDAENNGHISSTTYFIFDRDEATTALKSSNYVKVLQWDRRCLENYLIDLDAVSNVLMDPDVLKNPYTNQGDVSKLLRRLAFKQLDELAARNVYNSYNFGGVGLRKDDLTNRSVEETARFLLNRLQQVKTQLNSIDEAKWTEEFKNSVETERRQLEAVWESKWIFDCDGKRLIEDLRNEVKVSLSVKKFKIRLMKELMSHQFPSWLTIESQLTKLLK
jgi:predicted ATPase